MSSWGGFTLAFLVATVGALASPVQFDTHSYNFALDGGGGGESGVLNLTQDVETVCVDFDGPPDMARLAEIAASSTDKFVRVRWQVDEEHRQSVDRDAIAALFSGASELKVEARILPVTRSRAQGISLETTVERKLERWCELTEVTSAPLLERFQLLEANDAETIAAGILGGLDTLAPMQAIEAPLLSPESHSVPVDDELAVPDATVQTVSAPSSWLEDDLFAA